ncbi:HTH domain-containing protein [Novipirellula caenicola]|uniref:HTH HARE-type domain-containing protein n=1 Tax=Novipirellula caenicola TaxID=1536901 RepID=A0ABP9VVF0_9BACT
MKKAIHQVAADVLKASGKPMSAAEIYEVISEKGLYEFKAKNAASVLRSQLRRHTKNIAVANQAKECLFTQTEDGRFSLA